MSIEPCQLCGGAGFILRPLPPPPGSALGSGSHQATHQPYDPRKDEVPAGMEVVPCPVCSASGVNPGL